MNLQENKENAIAFYNMAFIGNPKEVVLKYVGSEYIQHNPDLADGKEGFIEYFDRMQKEYPQKEIRILRSEAEGDLVALHTHH